MFYVVEMSNFIQ